MYLPSFKQVKYERKISVIRNLMHLFLASLMLLPAPLAGKKERTSLPRQLAISTAFNPSLTYSNLPLKLNRSKINKIQSFSQLKNLNLSTISKVYIDLDETIFRPSGWVGTEDWFKTRSFKGSKDVIYSEMIQHEKRMSQAGYYEFMEKEVKELIEEWQRKEIKVIGVIAKPELSHERVEETLQQLGLSLDDVIYVGSRRLKSKGNRIKKEGRDDLSSVLFIDNEKQYLLSLDSLDDVIRIHYQPQISEHFKDSHYYLKQAKAHLAQKEFLKAQEDLINLVELYKCLDQDTVLEQESSQLIQELQEKVLIADPLKKFIFRGDAFLDDLEKLTSQGLKENDRGISSWDQVLKILEAKPHLIRRVYIDLDQTLFQPKGFLGTEHWYQCLKKRKFKDKEIKALKYALEEKFLKTGFFEEVEPGLVQRIQQLRKSRIMFCGLTARSEKRKKRTEQTLALLGLAGIPVVYQGKSINKGSFLLKTIEQEKEKGRQGPYLFVDDQVTKAFQKKDRPNLGPFMSEKYNLYPIGYYPPQKEYDFQNFYEKGIAHLKNGEKELALRFLIESLYLTLPEAGQDKRPSPSFYKQVASLLNEFTELTDFNELKELLSQATNEKIVSLIPPYIGLNDLKKNSTPVLLGGGVRGEVYQYQTRPEKGGIEVALKYAKANPHARNKNFFKNLFCPITRERKFNYLAQIYEIGEITPEEMEGSVGLKPEERKLGKILPYEIQELVPGKEAKEFLEEVGQKDTSPEKKKTLLAGVQILEQIILGLLELMELGLAGHGDLKFDNCMVYRGLDGGLHVKLVDLGAAGKMFFPLYKEKMATLSDVSLFFEKLPHNFSELMAFEKVETSFLSEDIFTSFYRGAFEQANLFETPPSNVTPFIWEYHQRNLEGKLSREEQERMNIGFQGIRNADIMGYTLRRGIFYMANDILKIACHKPFLLGKTTIDLKDQEEVTRTFFAYATLVSQVLLEIKPFESQSREKARKDLKTLFSDWQKITFEEMPKPNKSTQKKEVITVERKAVTDRIKKDLQAVIDRQEISSADQKKLNGKVFYDWVDEQGSVLMATVKDENGKEKPIRFELGQEFAGKIAYIEISVDATNREENWLPFFVTVVDTNGKELGVPPFEFMIHFEFDVDTSSYHEFYNEDNKDYPNKYHLTHFQSFDHLNGDIPLHSQAITEAFKRRAEKNSPLQDLSPRDKELMAKFYLTYAHAAGTPLAEIEETILEPSFIDIKEKEYLLFREKNNPSKKLFAAVAKPLGIVTVAEETKEIVSPATKEKQLKRELITPDRKAAAEGIKQLLNGIYQDRKVTRENKEKLDGAFFYDTIDEEGNIQITTFKNKKGLQQVKLELDGEFFGKIAYVEIYYEKEQESKINFLVTIVDKNGQELGVPPFQFSSYLSDRDVYPYGRGKYPCKFYKTHFEGVNHFEGKPISHHKIIKKIFHDKKASFSAKAFTQQEKEEMAKLFLMFAHHVRKSLNEFELDGHRITVQELPLSLGTEYWPIFNYYSKQVGIDPDAKSLNQSFVALAKDLGIVDLDVPQEKADFVPYENNSLIGLLGSSFTEEKQPERELLTQNIFQLTPERRERAQRVKKDILDIYERGKPSKEDQARLKEEYFYDVVDDAGYINFGETKSGREIRFNFGEALKGLPVRFDIEKIKKSEIRWVITLLNSKGNELGFPVIFLKNSLSSSSSDSEILLDLRKSLAFKTRCLEGYFTDFNHAKEDVENLITRTSAMRAYFPSETQLNRLFRNQKNDLRRFFLYQIENSLLEKDSLKDWDPRKVLLDKKEHVGLIGRQTRYKFERFLFGAEVYESILNYYENLLEVTKWEGTLGEFIAKDLGLVHIPDGKNALEEFLASGSPESERLKSDDVGSKQVITSERKKVADEIKKQLQLVFDNGVMARDKKELKGKSYYDSIDKEGKVLVAIFSEKETQFDEEVKPFIATFNEKNIELELGKEFAGKVAYIEPILSDYETPELLWSIDFLVTVVDTNGKELGVPPLYFSVHLQSRETAVSSYHDNKRYPSQYEFPHFEAFNHFNERPPLYHQKIPELLKTVSKTGVLIPALNGQQKEVLAKFFLMLAHKAGVALDELSPIVVPEPFEIKIADYIDLVDRYRKKAESEKITDKTPFALIGEELGIVAASEKEEPLSVPEEPQRETVDDADNEKIKEKIFNLLERGMASKEDQKELVNQYFYDVVDSDGYVSFGKTKAGEKIFIHFGKQLQEVPVRIEVESISIQHQSIRFLITLLDGVGNELAVSSIFLEASFRSKAWQDTAIYDRQFKVKLTENIFTDVDHSDFNGLSFRKRLSGLRAPFGISEKKFKKLRSVEKNDLRRFFLYQIENLPLEENSLSHWNPRDSVGQWFNKYLIRPEAHRSILAHYQNLLEGQKWQGTLGAFIAQDLGIVEAADGKNALDEVLASTSMRALAVRGPQPWGWVGSQDWFNERLKEGVNRKRVLREKREHERRAEESLYLDSQADLLKENNRWKEPQFYLEQIKSRENLDWFREDLINVLELTRRAELDLLAKVQLYNQVDFYTYQIKDKVEMAALWQSFLLNVTALLYEIKDNGKSVRDTGEFNLLLHAFFSRYFPHNPETMISFYKQGLLPIRKSKTKRDKGEFKFIVNEKNLYAFMEPMLRQIVAQNKKGELDKIVAIDTGARPLLWALEVFLKEMKLDKKIKLVRLPVSAKSYGDTLKSLRAWINFTEGLEKDKEWPVDHEVKIAELLNPLRQLDGEFVMVVDDNINDGETLDVVIRLLAEQGAKAISAATLWISRDGKIKKNWVQSIYQVPGQFHWGRLGPPVGIETVWEQNFTKRGIKSRRMELKEIPYDDLFPPIAQDLQSGDPSYSQYLKFKTALENEFKEFLQKNKESLKKGAEDKMPILPIKEITQKPDLSKRLETVYSNYLRVWEGMRHPDREPLSKAVLKLGEDKIQFNLVHDITKHLKEYLEKGDSRPSDLIGDQYYYFNLYLYEVRLRGQTIGKVELLEAVLKRNGEKVILINYVDLDYEGLSTRDFLRELVEKLGEFYAQNKNLKVKHLLIPQAWLYMSRPELSLPFRYDPWFQSRPLLQEPLVLMEVYDPTHWGWTLTGDDRKNFIEKRLALFMENPAVNVPVDVIEEYRRGNREAQLLNYRFPALNEERFRVLWTNPEMIQPKQAELERLDAVKKYLISDDEKIWHQRLKSYFEQGLYPPKKIMSLLKRFEERKIFFERQNNESLEPWQKDFEDELEDIENWEEEQLFRYQALELYYSFIQAQKKSSSLMLRRFFRTKGGQRCAHGLLDYFFNKEKIYDLRQLTPGWFAEKGLADIWNEVYKRDWLAVANDLFPGQYRLDESGQLQPAPLTEEEITAWLAGKRDHDFVEGRTLELPIKNKILEIPTDLVPNELKKVTFSFFHDQNLGLLLGVFDPDKMKFPFAVYKEGQLIDPFVEEVKRLRYSPEDYQPRPEGHPWTYSRQTIGSDSEYPRCIELKRSIDRVNGWLIRNSLLLIPLDEDIFIKHKKRFKNLLLAIVPDFNYRGITFQVFPPDEVNLEQSLSSQKALQVFDSKVDSEKVCHPLDLAKFDIEAYFSDRTNLKPMQRAAFYSLKGKGNNKLSLNQGKITIEFSNTDLQTRHWSLRGVHAELINDDDYGLSVIFFTEEENEKRIIKHLKLEKISEKENILLDLQRASLIDFTLDRKNQYGETIKPKPYAYPHSIPESGEISLPIIDEGYLANQHREIKVRGLEKLAGKQIIFVPQTDWQYGWRIAVHEQQEYLKNTKRKPDQILVRDLENFELISLKEYEKKGVSVEELIRFKQLLEQTQVSEFLDFESEKIDPNLYGYVYTYLAGEIAFNRLTSLFNKDNWSRIRNLKYKPSELDLPKEMELKKKHSKPKKRGAKPTTNPKKEKRTEPAKAKAKELVESPKRNLALEFRTQMEINRLYRAVKKQPQLAFKEVEEQIEKATHPEKRAALQAALTNYQESIVLELPGILREVQTKKQVLRPDLYQKQGVLFLENTPKSILADQPGLGKTFQIIAQVLRWAASPARRNQLNIALAVVTKKGLKVWRTEINKWTRNNHPIFVLNKAGGMGTLYHGKNDEKGIKISLEEFVERCKKEPPKEVPFVLITYDVLKGRFSSLFKKLNEFFPKEFSDYKQFKKEFVNYKLSKQDVFEKIQAKLTMTLPNDQRIEIAEKLNLAYGTYEAIRNLHAGFMVVDEAHRMKNEDSLQTQALKYLNGADHKVLATATPLMARKLSKLWPLLNWLFPEKYPSLKDFKKRFPDEIPDEETLDAKTYEKKLAEVVKKRWHLHLELKPFMLRRKVKQVLEDVLPPKNPPEYHRLKFSEEDAKEYEKMEKVLAFWMKKETKKSKKYSRNELIKAFTRLRQFTSGFRSVKGEMDTYLEENPKVKRLDQILEAKIKAGEKVVVFAKYVGTVNALARRYERKIKEWTKETYGENESPVCLLNDDDIDRFEEDPKAVAFFTGYAGAESIGLTAANNLVLFDLDWDWPEQPINRIYRHGQTKSVNIIYLIMENTIDEIILKIQNQKAEVFSDAIEGGAPPEEVRKSDYKIAGEEVKRRAASRKEKEGETAQELQHYENEERKEAEFAPFGPQLTLLFDEAI